MFVTADWVQVEGGIFFRKKTLYPSLPWNSELDLQECYLSVGVFGGPIAVWRKQPAAPSKQVILIYSGSGILQSSIKWSSGPFLTCGWSNKQELLCIQADGMVQVYNLHGEMQRTFGFGKDAKDSKVIDARIYQSPSGTGIVVLTSLFRFYAMTNIETGMLKRLPDVPGLNSSPSAWFAFTNEDDKKSVIFVANRRDVFLLDPSETATFQQYPELNGTGRIIAAAASVTGRDIAMATENGVLWIGSSDFREKFSEIKLEGGPISQIAWVGITAVVCSQGDSVSLVSVEGSSTTYYYQSVTVLVQEIDSVRILSSDSHDLIQKVPKVTLDIFRIGSMEPGSMLLEAAKEYQNRSYKCEEYIRLTHDQLPKAVKQCIEAAGHEFDPELQKSLLRAAQLGKGFVENHNPDQFVNMARTLRILNAIRSDQIGMPLTYEQLKYLSTPVLLDRLVARRHFHLALEIAKFLRLSEADGVSRILTHWACFKMKEAGSDPEAVAREIAERVRGVPGISPGDIAAKAMQVSKQEAQVKDSSFLVYAKLLEYESNSRKQVRFLLKMGQESGRTSSDVDRTALARALESGDSDLIVEVLMHLKDKMNKGELQMLIRQYPVAMATYINILREKSPSILRDIYEQEDDFSQEAAYFLTEAYRENQSVDNRLTSLLAARDCAKKGRNEENAQLIDDAHKLLKLQRDLKQKYGEGIVDKSLCDTLRELWSRGEGKQAEEWARVFRLSEKRLWWLKVHCFSDLGEWAELEKLSKTKKSPIGYEPFVDACLKTGSMSEAVKYLPKVKEENKIDYFLKAGLYEDAIQLAYDRKDGECLLYLQSQVSSKRHLVDKINALKTQLDSKR